MSERSTGRATTATGAGAAPTRGSLAPLEREAELAELDRLRGLTTGGQGALALIEGAAGIGKTALLRELRARAEPAGTTVLSARGSELEREFGFGVVRQLLEPALAALDAPERERVTAGAAALAEAVLAGPEASPQYGHSGESPQAALHGLYWFCANLAEHGPLLLAIDDAHWADRPSLAFIDYLARRLEAVPVLVALAVRSGEPGGEAEPLLELARASEASVLRPAALSPAAVGALANAELGDEVDEDVVAACHAASGGNPFLLNELLSELRERQRSGIELHAAEVPRTEARGIAALVAGRLARIGGAAPGLARALAVLGDGSELRLLASLAEVPSEAAGEAADALVEAGILGPGRPLGFLHPLLRAAVYGELGESDRARGHARAARLLADAGAAPEAVAAHLLVSEPAGDPWVVETLSETARTSLARGAPEAAVPYLRRALEERLPKARPALLGELGRSEVLAAEYGPGVEHLREAIELAKDPAGRAELVDVLVQAILLSESMREAARALEGELAAQRRAPVEVRRHLQAKYASLIAFTIDADPATGHELDGIPGHEGHGHSPDDEAGRALLVARGVWLVLTAGSDASAAAATITHALDAGARDDALPPSPAFWGPLYGLICADEFAPARELGERGLEHARVAGSPVAAAQATNLLAILEFRMGSLARAEALADEALEISATAGARIGQVGSLAPLIECLAERGRSDYAWALLKDHGCDGELPAIFTSAFLAEGRGHLRLLEGDHRGAVDDFLQAGEFSRRCGFRNPAVTAWRSKAALAYHVLGERDEARQLAREELELARSFRAPRALGISLRVLGLIEGGDRGLELLHQAVALLEPSEARLEYARALVDLGAALRRDGARAKARERLGAGMDLAHRCGAVALAERARNELIAAGARPRRLALTGLDSLTPSERRVAKLAAEGFQNKEIAQALFVTLRTVEMHLGNTYRKLEISSRAELPAKLHP